MGNPFDKKETHFRDKYLQVNLFVLFKVIQDYTLVFSLTLSSGTNLFLDLSSIRMIYIEERILAEHGRQERRW